MHTWRASTDRQYIDHTLASVCLIGPLRCTSSVYILFEWNDFFVKDKKLVGSQKTQYGFGSQMYTVIQMILNVLKPSTMLADSNRLSISGRSSFNYRKFLRFFRQIAFNSIHNGALFCADFTLSSKQIPQTAKNLFSLNFVCIEFFFQKTIIKNFYEKIPERTQVYYFINRLLTVSPFKVCVEKCQWLVFQ